MSKIRNTLWICHPSRGSSKQKAREGPANPTLANLQQLKPHAALTFDVFRGIVVFIKLPSHYSSHRMEDYLVMEPVGTPKIKANRRAQQKTIQL
jgi:hypothetical protein